MPVWAALSLDRAGFAIGTISLVVSIPTLHSALRSLNNKVLDFIGCMEGSEVSQNCR